MTWIADLGLASAASWVTLVMTGVVVGVLGARWNDPARSHTSADGLTFAAAAAAVVTWFAHAGTLLAGNPPSQLLDATVPTSVPPGYRLAVLWSTASGASLSIAATLLVFAALARERDRTRFVALLGGGALVSIAVAIWMSPQPGASTSILPAFVQSPFAALAPLCALVAVLMLVVIFARRLSGNTHFPRALAVGSWIASTAALACEQVARSRLGIGPRDPIVFGSASSGLAVWVFTSALLHGRVQRALLRTSSATRSAGARTPAAVLAHIGAACVVVSFALHAVAKRATVALTPGVSAEVTDAYGRSWRLAHQGISRFDTEGVEVTALALEAALPSGDTRLLAPEAREYHDRQGRHFEAPVMLRRETGGLTQTMRVLFIGADSLDVANVRITFLPVPILWPLGIALLILAAVFAWMPQRRPSSP